MFGKDLNTMSGYPAPQADSGINRPPIPATPKSGRFNPGLPGRFIPVWVADSSRFARPIYPGIRTCIEPAAMDLLATASEGLPRTINLLARAAWIEAGKAKAMSITPEHVQPALRLVPTARDMIAGQK